MNFAAYIKSQPRGAMARLAAASGVTYQSIKNIRIGRVDKFTQWETAFAVWRACKGRVEMKHLLVNWEDILKVVIVEASELSLRTRRLNKILKEPVKPRTRKVDALRIMWRDSSSTAKFRRLVSNVEALGLPEHDPHMELIIDCIMSGDVAEAEDLVKRKIKAMGISDRRKTSG